MKYNGKLITLMLVFLFILILPISSINAGNDENLNVIEKNIYTEENTNSENKRFDEEKIVSQNNFSESSDTLSGYTTKDLTFNVLYDDHPEVQGYNFTMIIYVFNPDNPYYEPTYPESAWEHYDYIDFYNLENDNSVLYEEFPYLDGEGDLLQYKFEIDNHYNGDNYKYNIVVEGNVDDGFNIWVKLKSPEDLTVTKQWIGGPKEKPKVYFQLYRSYSYWYIAARNSTNYQIIDALNAINNNDNLSSYIDFSDTTPGWIWSNPSNGGWEEYTVEDPYGSYYQRFEKVGDIVELNNETLQATFENMPQYIDYQLWDQKGSAKIYYYVREVDENGNDYEHEDYISGPVLPNENEGDFTAQNIYNKLEIPVKKIWKGTEKDEIEVILLKHGQEIERIKLNKDSNWEGTFELPKYEEFCNIQQILPPPPGDYEGDWNYDWHYVIEEVDPLLPCDDLRILDLLEEIRNGDFPYHTRFVKELREIEYTNLTIKEVEVDGYTSIISGDYKEGFEIVNSKIIPKTEITFYKQWINGPETKPTIEVQLYRDGEPYGDSVTLVNDELSYTWNDLDETDEFDNIYVYTVDEVNVPEGYEKAVDGLIITNTFIIEKTEVTMNKEWIDGPETKPTIEVQLYRDGEAYRDPVTLVDGELSYTWTDLDKTDSKGNMYKYTVDEINVPEDYEKAVDGLTIRNKFIIEKTEITANKIWIGGTTLRPSIELQLYRNKETYGDPVTLVDGELSYTWTDLDATDSEGNIYEYTVDEVNVPRNYKKDIVGLTILNTFVIEKTEVTANKIWIGGQDTRPTIELQLYRNGEACGDPIALVNGETSYTWTDLDKTDSKGNMYEYTVDEINVPEGYEKAVDGLIITNTFVDEVPIEPKDPKNPEVQVDVNKPKNPPNPTINGETNVKIDKITKLPITGSFAYLHEIGVLLIIIAVVLWSIKEIKYRK